MAATPLLEVGIALLTLAVVGTLAYRLNQSVIPAYILAGILVGPYVPTEIAGLSLQLVSHTEFVQTVAELGIILLLFFLGLEFHVGTLLSNPGRISKIGGIDLLFNGAIGVLIGVAFGLDATGIILLTGIVYISSSAIITKSLTDVGWLPNPEAEVILSTLVVEDIVIAIYLAFVSAVLLGGGSLEEASITVVQSVLYLAVLAAIAYTGTEYIERLFDLDADELFLLGVFGIMVSIGAVALVIGVSEAVAAFFAGTAFSETDLVERIERLLTPLRDLFAAVFFFAIGLTTDLRLIIGVTGLLLVAVLLTTASKLLSGTLSGRLYGLSDRRALRVGFGLVPRGEFSLIIATMAATSQSAVVRETIPPFAVGYVLAMSIVGALFIQYEPRLSPLLQRTPK